MTQLCILCTNAHNFKPNEHNEHNFMQFFVICRQILHNYIHNVIPNPIYTKCTILVVNPS